MEQHMKHQQSLLDQMRFLNKRIFNRITLRFAGASYSPISIIRHVGRRSRSHYTTPVIAIQPFGNQFIFALPYGSNVDWYRNLLAAGQGTVICYGEEYHVEKPQPLDAKGDLAALPFLLGLIVKFVGVQHFIQMKSAKVIR
jgi:deazaflavin-dependent oxidoreductase (nitroreductase family)